MFYDFTVTVPAATTKTSPVTQTLKLTKGVLNRVEVRFRYGCDFRVKCRIYYHEQQVFPTNPDGEFSEDGRAIVWDDFLELKSAPHSLKVKAYSPTAAYQHIIYIRVGVLPKEILMPFAGLGGMLRKFLQMVGIGR